MIEIIINPNTLMTLSNKTLGRICMKMSSTQRGKHWTKILSDEWQRRMDNGIFPFR